MFVYSKENVGLKKQEGQNNILQEKIVWIDLENPSHAEEMKISTLLNIQIPSQQNIDNIEVSKRLYIKNGVIYMTVVLVTNYDTAEPENCACTFILTTKKLITIRYSNIYPFQVFSDYIARLAFNRTNNIDLYIGLLESIIEHLADILESIGISIDVLRRQIFLSSCNKEEGKKVDYKLLLRQIGNSGDLISKTIESLVTLSRMVTFFTNSQANLENLDTSKFTTISKDIKALNNHATFLSTKVNFLLDATLGMINIDQNNIIKIFSVAAVIFLPPTLVASIYGMNFNFMPELQWHYGYLFSILIMLLSAWLPYMYFKKRKWL